MIGRIPILDVEPVVECGRRQAKAVAGETFQVSATVIREGHGALGAGAVLRDPEGRVGPLVTMRELGPGSDRYGGDVTVTGEGIWHFRVESWSDPIAAWQHDAGIKIPRGQDVELMLTEGALLFERAARSIRQPPGATRPAAARTALNALARRLRDRSMPPWDRLAAAQAPSIATVLAEYPLRDMVTRSGWHPVLVERLRALYGSWYEFFPRSEGVQFDPLGRREPVSGTLRTAARRLEAIADMGFDVVYLPPVHPIGTTFRKGRNNTLEARPVDPGSPWAIGAPEGGHDAIHPDLGTFADFDAFVARARKLGLEVAIDLALQASPDHPWVKEHPEWFTTRADGTIAYAENPPKKYQDIYPFNFDNDPEGIYAEFERIVRLWMGHGVRIFRVDNPHTKPLRFWERLLASIRRTDPDVLFLAEAFTRPAMMASPGQGRLPPVLHVLHLAHDQGRADRVPDRAVRPGRPRTCGRTSSPTRPTSCTSTCSTAACPRLKSGRCWQQCLALPGVSTPAMSYVKIRRCGRAAKSTWTRRSTSTGRATGRPRPATGSASPRS